MKRMILFPLILFTAFLSLKACSGEATVTTSFLDGDSRLVPAQITLSTLRGDKLFKWDKTEAINALTKLLQTRSDFQKENFVRRTQTGYMLTIYFVGSAPIQLLVYGTTETPTIWRITYSDPADSSERLVKSVRVEPEQLPTGLRNDLRKTSLLPQ